MIQVCCCFIKQNKKSPATRVCLDFFVQPCLLRCCNRQPTAWSQAGGGRPALSARRGLPVDPQSTCSLLGNNMRNRSLSFNDN